MTEQDISILIPTLNRAPFLARALDYYASVGFRGQVLIGDSSPGEHADANLKAIAAVKDTLDVKLMRCAVLKKKATDDLIGLAGEAICLIALIDEVRTPYAAIAGDDDFQIPAALAECAEFLRGNPGYSGAHGVRLEFRTRQDRSRGEVVLVRRTLQPHLEQASASDRWRSYARLSISPLYSVLRTETWRDIFKGFPSVSMRYVGSEFLPSALSAVVGKVKEIPRLSTVHQHQENRILDWWYINFYSMMMHPNWTTSVRNLRRIVAEALAEADGIPLAEAEETFDKEFWGHLSRGLSSQYGMRYGKGGGDGQTGDFLTPVGRVLRKAVGAAKNLKRFSPGDVNAGNGVESGAPIDLNRLLNPSHPLHSDYMAVHRVVTDTSPADS